METPFRSSHNLDFMVAESPIGLKFKVGTCSGLYAAELDSYVLIVIVNDMPGNGHLDDVFEWFENSCRRDNKNLVVAAIMNDRFYQHLIKKRGFKVIDKENVVKIFNKPAYELWKLRGNKTLKSA